MGAKNSPKKEVETFNDSFDVLMGEVYEKTLSLINRGDPPDIAFKKALGNVGFKKEFTDLVWKAISDSLTSGAGAADISAISKRKIWLNTVWPGEKLKLSSRINDVSRMADIRQTIKIGMKRADGWRGIAETMAAKNFQGDNLAQYMRRLEGAARSALAGDPAAAKEYTKALKTAQRNIEKLSQAGAPTMRLKAAYQDLLTATIKGSEKALQKTLKTAIVEKSRYNAERIARTESARAYSQAIYKNVRTDNQVIGLKYSLSSRHPHRDICDFRTGVDLFGMGKGVYPLGALPEFPFHPNCLCGITKKYLGDTGPMDEKKAIAYLQGLSEPARIALMGKDGAAAFEANPQAWHGYLKGYSAGKSIESM